MDKAEIIARTLTQMKHTMVHQPPISVEPDEEDFVISVLRDLLPQGDIKTCHDFRHFNVDCCQVCHENPHYELSVIELPGGGKAWVCDAVKKALHPERYRSFEEAEPILRKIFGEPTTL